MKITVSANNDIARVTDVAKNQGWDVLYMPGGPMQFTKYSPYFEEIVITAHGDTAEEIADVVSRQHDAFDPGRHVLERLNDEADYDNYIGVDIVRNYADDAEEIEAMLENLRDALRGLAAEIE